MQAMTFGEAVLELNAALDALAPVIRLGQLVEEADQILTRGEAGTVPPRRHGLITRLEHAQCKIERVAQAAAQGQLIPDAS